jgi:hypothetical protein
VKRYSSTARSRSIGAWLMASKLGPFKSLIDQWLEDCCSVAAAATGSALLLLTSAGPERKPELGRLGRRGACWFVKPARSRGPPDLPDLLKPGTSTRLLVVDRCESEDCVLARPIPVYCDRGGEREPR